MGGSAVISLGRLLVIVIGCAGCGLGAAEAAPRPLTIRQGAAGVDYVYLPGGRCPMRGAAEGQQRWVTLSPFWCARQPVTKGIYRRFLEATGQPVPPEMGPPGALPFESEEQWGRQLAKRGMPTDDHRFGSTLVGGEQLTAWLSEQEGRRVQLISEAQFEYVRRSGEIHGDESFWWQARQPSGLGAWLPNRDYQQTPPEPFGCLAGLYTQTPWRVFLAEGSYWMRDRYVEKLPGGEFIDPVLTEADAPPMRFPVHVTIGYPFFYRHPNADEAGLRGTVLLVAEVLPQDAQPPAPAPVRPEPPTEIVDDLPRQVLDLGGGVTLAMRQVPAGRFTMGRERKDRPWTDEWPATEVDLQAYWLGETEVTQAQFRAITGINPSLVPGDDLPVHSVTFPEMLAFCDLLTQRERAAGRLAEGEEYRCPTEAEWERAALAGARTRYAFGDDAADLPFYGWVDVADGPFPVGVKRPNRWGFFDMAGNVLEMLSEKKRKLPGTLVDTNWIPSRYLGGWIAWISARGGAWNMGAPAAEATIRREMPISSRCYHIGFRLARGPSLPVERPQEVASVVFERARFVEDPAYQKIVNHVNQSSTQEP